MKKVLVFIAGVLLMAASAAVAAQSEFQKWAESQTPEGLTNMMLDGGLLEAADRSAIIANRSEDNLVDTIIRKNAYNLLLSMPGLNKASPANMAKINDAFLSGKVTPDRIGGFITGLDVADRKMFEPVAIIIWVSEANGVYRSTPQYGRLYVKYFLMQNIPCISDNVSEDDLVALLLAPEVITVSDAEKTKQSLKNRAVVLARKKLRAEGKTFVVKNGINPLTEKIQPVVDALNAPLCTGLEVAFRALGSDIKDVDRTDLIRFGADCKEKVDKGETKSDEETVALLGKVSIVLGAAEYNKFVDSYNNGAGAGK